MAQWVKALVIKSDNLSSVFWDSCDGRKEMTTTSCPLTSQQCAHACVCKYACMHMHRRGNDIFQRQVLQTRIGYDCHWGLGWNIWAIISVVITDPL